MRHPFPTQTSLTHSLSSSDRNDHVPRLGIKHRDLDPQNHPRKNSHVEPSPSSQKKKLVERGPFFFCSIRFVGTCERRSLFFFLTCSCVCVSEARTSERESGVGCALRPEESFWFVSNARDARGRNVTCKGRGCMQRVNPMHLWIPWTWKMPDPCLVWDVILASKMR